MNPIVFQHLGQTIICIALAIAIALVLTCIEFKE